MPQRARGYHYVRGPNGRKRRVYTKGRKGGRSKNSGRYSVNAARSYRRPRRDAFGDTLMGYGSYRKVGSRGRKVNMGRQAPRIVNSNGRFIIQHTEYLGDLSSTQAFVNTGFYLNPGIAAGAEGGFTNWLPKVAANFEQWKPRGIAFYWKSTSSDAVLSSNASSALGTISMATDYNVLNGVFGSKLQMENYEHSVSCKPSVNMTHLVECARRETPISELYIRTSAVPAGADQRLYDLGLFQLATSGNQSVGGVLGELWVSYEIELLKPRIEIGGVDADVSFDHFLIYNSTKATVGVVPAAPFGTSTTVPIYPTTESTLGGVCCGGAVTAASFAPQLPPTGVDFVGGINVLDASGVATGAKGAATANKYYFPSGQSDGNFMVQYLSLYTTGGATWTPVPTYVNCEALDLIASAAGAANGENFDFNASATTSVDAMVTIFVHVTGPNASITFPGSTGAYATPIYAELYVVQLPAVIN